MAIEGLGNPLMVSDPFLCPSFNRLCFPKQVSQLKPVLRFHPSLGVTKLKITKQLRISVGKASIKCASDHNQQILKTCKNCKTQFDPALNHPTACRFHTAHFGGETKRKFESVYTGGTMNTPNSGTVLQYWHCCGSEDPFDPGCTAAPHSSYDD